MADNNAMEVRTIENDKRIQEYTQRLRELRKDGETKVMDIKIDITALKKNQLIDERMRERRLLSLRRRRPSLRKLMP